MHFEKCQCGLLREAFCSDGEGSSRCRREGGGVILKLGVTGLNKTGLQPVSRPVEQILGFYLKGLSAKNVFKK